MKMTLQQIFGQMRSDLLATDDQPGLIGASASDAVDLVLAAMLSEKNVLLVGPPGTAKSMLATSVASWIKDGNSFTLHCCKDTKRTNAFGAANARKQIEENVIERCLVGGAADAHILVLEEVFKAGPAVLDTMLMLLNERVYNEGMFHAKAKLITAIAVSNEWSPEGCGDQINAFWDRLTFRMAVHPISTEADRRRLVMRRDHTPVLTTSITPDEIKQAAGEAALLTFTKDAEEAFFAILADAARDGIQPGDRRQYQAFNACQAFAYLVGDNEVRPEHLEILIHVLWTDPVEQPDRLRRIVARIANPVSMAISELLREVDEVMATDLTVLAACELADEKLQEIYGKLAETPGDKAADAAKYVNGIITNLHLEASSRRTARHRRHV